MNAIVPNNINGSRLIDPDSGYAKKLTLNRWIELISIFIFIVFFVLTAVITIEHGKITKAIFSAAISIIEHKELTKSVFIALILVVFKDWGFAKSVLAAVIFALSKHGEVTKIYFAFLIFILLTIIRTTLHELCHKWSYEMLSGEKATIQWLSITPNCRFTAPVSVPFYVSTCLAPLIVTAGTGLVFTISFMVNTPFWIQAIFALSTALSWLGSSMDIYWVLLVRKFPRDYKVIDDGKCAKVFAPDFKTVIVQHNNSSVC